MYCVNVVVIFAVLLGPVQGVQIRFIAMAIGNQNSGFGYEVFGSAFDVAMEEARKLYPRVYENLTMTRYFVPGRFTCEDAVDHTTVGLSTMYRGTNNSIQSKEKEFRIILAPGCSFETIVLGDFAREEDVPMFVSSASLDVLGNKKRFPTVLPWSSSSYYNMVLALLETVKLFEWTTFNFVCDVTKADPSATVALEVLCGIMQQVFQRARGISMMFLQFDSSDPEAYQPMLASYRRYSAVTVFATARKKTYEQILIGAAKAGMANGEYAFLAFSCFDQLDEWDIPESTSPFLLEALPYVFTLSNDHVHYSTIDKTLNRMSNTSLTVYNWTIAQDLTHNPALIAAYETVLIISQVLNETLELLDRIDGATFARKFFNRTFPLRSRHVSISPTGVRLSNVFIHQMRKDDRSGWDGQNLMKYDALTRQLLKLEGFTSLRWNRGVFPPLVVPVCGFHHEWCGHTGNWIVPTVVGVAALLMVFAAMTLLVSILRSKRRVVQMWWELSLDDYKEVKLRRRSYHHLGSRAPHGATQLKFPTVPIVV